MPEFGSRRPTEGSDTVENVKHRLSAADIILIAVLTVITAAILFSRFAHAEGGTVCIVSSPEGTNRYPLSEDRTIEISSNGIELRLEISDGQAAVTYSTCPDGICRNTGAVSRPGQAIVCVPAQISVKVSGGSEGDADFIIP